MAPSQSFHSQMLILISEERQEHFLQRRTRLLLHQHVSAETRRGSWQLPHGGSAAGADNIYIKVAGRRAGRKEQVPLSPRSVNKCACEPQGSACKLSSLKIRSGLMLLPWGKESKGSSCNLQFLHISDNYLDHWWDLNDFKPEQWILLIQRATS